MIIFFILLLLITKCRVVIKKMKNHPFKSDIIVSPCGFYGLYNLGICNYIKNHFILKGKRITGLSSGSFNAVFLCLKKKKSQNIMLKELFRLNHNKKNIMKYATDILSRMRANFKIEDVRCEDLYIGLSHTNDLVFHHNFNNMDQLLHCCMGSSFIPGITHKNLIYFYENRYTLDGAVWYRYYKKYIDTDKTLIISPKLFNRYNSPRLMYDSLFRKNLNLYQLYLNGYHDAKKNHNYFKRYLKEKIKLNLHHSSSYSS
jgi:hypothetical protein